MPEGRMDDALLRQTLARLMRERVPEADEQAKEEEEPSVMQLSQEISLTHQQIAEVKAELADEELEVKEEITDADILQKWCQPVSSTSAADADASNAGASSAADADASMRSLRLMKKLMATRRSLRLKKLMATRRSLRLIKKAMASSLNALTRSRRRKLMHARRSLRLMKELCKHTLMLPTPLHTLML